jgi:hypothetical protein
LPGRQRWKNPNWSDDRHSSNRRQAQILAYRTFYTGNPAAADTRIRKSGRIVRLGLNTSPNIAIEIMLPASQVRSLFNVDGDKTCIC